MRVGRLLCLGTVKLLTFATVGSALAVAGSICPAGNGANPFGHNPDNAATGCNVVITIAANGTASTVVKDSTPYENSEDVLVGVVNNSATPLASLSVGGGTGSDIFGFDGDGICTFTFVGSTYCSGTFFQNDPGDYGGPTTSSFTNITTGDSGTVNFSPAVAASGGTTYFSLEGIPAAFTATPTTPPTTPAPPALLLLLTGLAALGMWQLGRRFASRPV
jgi:hypothetical protein